MHYVMSVLVLLVLLVWVLVFLTLLIRSQDSFIPIIIQNVRSSNEGFIVEGRNNILRASIGVIGHI